MQIDKQADRQTDRHTDRLTGRQTDKVINGRPYAPRYEEAFSPYRQKTASVTAQHTCMYCLLLRGQFVEFVGDGAIIM